MYKGVFETFDSDNSGKINFSEVENLIQSISERKPHEYETKEVKTRICFELLYIYFFDNLFAS